MMINRSYNLITVTPGDWAFSNTIPEKLKSKILSPKNKQYPFISIAKALLWHAEDLGIKEITKTMGGNHKNHHQRVL